MAVRARTGMLDFPVAAPRRGVPSTASRSRPRSPSSIPAFPSARHSTRCRSSPTMPGPAIHEWDNAPVSARGNFRFVVDRHQRPVEAAHSAMAVAARLEAAAGSPDSSTGCSRCGPRRSSPLTSPSTSPPGPTATEELGPAAEPPRWWRSGRPDTPWGTMSPYCAPPGAPLLAPLRDYRRHVGPPGVGRVMDSDPNTGSHATTPTGGHLGHGRRRRGPGPPAPRPAHRRRRSHRSCPGPIRRRAWSWPDIRRCPGRRRVREADHRRGRGLLQRRRPGTGGDGRHHRRGPFDHVHGRHVLSTSPAASTPRSPGAC